MPPKRKVGMYYSRPASSTSATKEYKRDNFQEHETYEKIEANETDDDTKEEKDRKPPVSDIILSREQQNVVNDLLQQKNVLVIAKAGSGKSSVALSAAHQYHNKFKQRTLLITYNARLKDETRSRIKRLGLDHSVECHSYHAVASKFFVPRTEGGTADDALIHCATQITQPIVPLNFGMIVIDEAQDMNPLYANFVKHIIRFNSCKPVMLIVGDPFQRIFSFHGSTCDYMIYPRKNFGSLCHQDSFATHHLTICWRITHEMAKFINAHMNPCNLQHAFPEWWKENGERIQAWWAKGIRANPKRPAAPDSVKIVRGWGSREIVSETQKLFDAYGNDEVALLAFSLKGEKTPIRAIVDRMGKHSNENWAVLAGSSSSAEEVLSGKRLASTIHRMKGLERRGIVVCGMDAFIEKIYTTDPLEHFNLFYVACTRAKDRLLINSTGIDYATIRCSALADTAKAKQDCEISQLVGYVPFDSILSVPENLFTARVELTFPEKALELNRQTCIVEGRAAGTVEDLSPFMSRAISFKLMLLIHGKLYRIAVDQDNKAYDRDMIEFIHQFYDQVEVASGTVTWPSLVKYAVAYETLRSKYKHLWRQLTDYDAFTPSALLEKCTLNALNLLWMMAKRQGLVQGEITDFTQTSERASQLKSFVDFEVPVAIPFYPDWFLHTYVGQISGVADIIFAGTTVVGIECSDSIPAERGLELALYAATRQLISTPSTGSVVGAEPLKTVMILTNTAQLVSVVIKIPALHDQVPVAYELLHRSARRKMQLEAVSQENLLKDYMGRGGKKATNTEKPKWMNLFD